jgi:hypothetical protein
MSEQHRIKRSFSGGRVEFVGFVCLSASVIVSVAIVLLSAGLLSKFLQLLLPVQNARI